jgi:hypothetical protein
MESNYAIAIFIIFCVTIFGLLWLGFAALNAPIIDDEDDCCPYATGEEVVNCDYNCPLKRK